ncbi:hypothetical protein [Legionella gresilensis]|uniref:hypothetical protein n=1 Tax=Legionella gresilensis TaxID=91823 RepID=UPI001041677F|nr:hypothetical protein [Legionella gresilensis]
MSENNHHFLEILGEILLEEIKNDLNKSNTESLFKFFKNFDNLMQNLTRTLFGDLYRKMAQYKQYYNNANDPSLKTPADLWKEFDKVQKDLKEAHRELKDMLLQPALTFAAVTHPEYAADPKNLHPAQEIFEGYVNVDCLKHIMGYAGFYHHKLHKPSSAPQFTPLSDEEGEATHSAVKPR